MSKRARTRLLVAPRIQFVILGKAFGYACFGLLVLSGPLFLFEMHPGVLDDQGAWSLVWPMFITWLALLPIVLFSVLKQSSKLVGPMLRLRASMRKLAEGEHVEPLRFRKRDFWHDLAEDFNALLRHVEEGRDRAASDDTRDEWVEEPSGAAH